MSSRLINLAPIGFDRLVTPLIRERLCFVFVAGTDGFEHRRVFEIKEVIGLGVSVAVRSAHEPVADHADVERFHIRVRCLV